ncbi:MAG: DNA starvation/stationary phase protection protein [Mollicutes bacterium]|nr:DNA starvation/stationary phase protection protein [Mollicutes bacterium]
MKNCYNNIDLSDILNEYLANLKVLINNLYNLHFNVVGEDFFQIHAKLQEYYEKITLMYDEVAERIKMMGKYPITSLKTFEDVSNIKSMRSQDYTISQTLEIVINDFNFMLDFSKAIYMYANELNDTYTVDMMTDYIKFFEKQLWMLKSSLKYHINMCYGSK